jgi:hypothetical protein
MANFSRTQANGAISRAVRELQDQARANIPSRTPGMLTSVTTVGTISRPRIQTASPRVPPSNAARWA